MNVPLSTLTFAVECPVNVIAVPLDILDTSTSPELLVAPAVIPVLLAVN